VAVAVRGALGALLVRGRPDHGRGFELDEPLQGVLADGAQDVDVGAGEVVEEGLGCQTEVGHCWSPG
jgi:hypothetical protein